MRTTEIQVISLDDLPLSNIAREFVGEDHGGAGICAILVDAPAGRGASLHRHPYEEVFITLEGQATFFLGEDEQREVGPGEIVVVPSGQWHGFVNSGGGPLRQIDVHVSPSFDTEWREG
jgi:mannose-6-phosphate isomerase-like protein (cupin superfamily)